jgi:hypothetical protein
LRTLSNAAGPGYAVVEADVIHLFFVFYLLALVAGTISISQKTVENHVYNIYQKLKVKNRVQLFQLMKANTLE